MGSSRKHREKWQVQVRRQDSKRISKTFHRKADAQAWARKMEQEADQAGILVVDLPGSVDGHWFQTSAIGLTASVS
jgi:hypothetical protein